MRADFQALKILDSVVELVSVDVMNAIARRCFRLVMIFPDDTVRHDPFPVTDNEVIAIRAEMTGPRRCVSFCRIAVLPKTLIVARAKTFTSARSVASFNGADEFALNGHMGIVSR